MNMTIRKRSYIQFNRAFLMTVVSIVFGVGAFNFIMDPYGVMNTPKIHRLNKLKPTKENHTRLFKAVEVIRLKPQHIILGTSRANLGLDPRHPAFSNEGSETSYNLGLQDANVYEILRYFEHAIANQSQVKNIAIGMDYLSFNEHSKPKAGFDETMLGMQKISGRVIVNLLLSLDALSASQKTLAENVLKGRHNSEFVNGMRVLHIDKLPWTMGYFTNGFTRLSNVYTDYQLSQKRLNDLETIVRICRENNINLKLFISPIHATQLEAIRAAGGWDTFEQWKREVAKIAPFWDFSGYNSLTTEAIATQMTYYQDSSHYRPEVGNLVLNRIFNYQLDRVPDDFGVLVTPETIESHLQQLRVDREVWASDRQKLIQTIADLMEGLPQS